MKRYYSPSLDRGLLDVEQSHHCSNVNRQVVGDLFAAFDGRGQEAKARITEITREQVKFEVLAKASSPRPLHPIWLAQALTKPKSMDMIIQKATELGVSELAVLQSDHSVAHVDNEKVEARVEKWQKLTIEAAKQCGQNWLPVVDAPRTPKDFVNAIPSGAVKMIASLQPEARPLKTALREQLQGIKAGTPLIIMVGPEGDFTPAEIGQARAAGFIPVSLGKIILRAETAAFFTLSAIAYELME
jgi:16S rRNA (uracil1498-N3)-methyltransferase